MASIKKYIKKDGSTAYMFNAYLGVDPSTGKSKRTTRRGFRTQKEAKLALSRLELEIDTNGFSKQNQNSLPPPLNGNGWCRKSDAQFAAQPESGEI